MMPVMQFVGNLGYVGVCVAGGIFVTNGTLQVGDIQSFTQYVQLFTQPISSVANIANIIQSTIASAERVFEMMDEEEEKTKFQLTLIKLLAKNIVLYSIT